MKSPRLDQGNKHPHQTGRQVPNWLPKRVERTTLRKILEISNVFSSKYYIALHNPCMLIQDWAQYSLSITFVLLMLAATLWWLSRRKNGFLPKNETRRIQILETNTLGLKNKLLLVQVDRQLLLLAINSNEIQKLHAWSMDSDMSATQESPDVI